MPKEHRFDLFRFSLLRRSDPSIFDALHQDTTREEWLRTLFSKKTVFRHHGTEYVYVPLDPDTTLPYVVGKIGREVADLEYTAPEDGYQEYIHEAWKAAVVVVDPTEHEDGQKLAIQFHPEVGRPSMLAPRLLQAMEDQELARPYLVAVHPITSSEAFWDFIARNEGKVTKIRFELEVPNMFGGDDEFTREMREFRDREHAQTVAIEIKNPDGIDADTDRVRYTAEKAMSQGTGSVKAKAVGKRNTFNSNEQVKSARLEADEEDRTVPLIERAASLANRILGREQT